MRIWFGIVLLLVTSFSFGQEKNVKWGYLRDSVTHEAIVLASVTNISTKTTVMTSATGRFKIDLKENQIISFAAVGYYFDTLHYTNALLTKDTLELYLSPLAHNLGNVTVTSKGMSRYQLDSIERRNEFLHDIVSYKIPTFSDGNSGAGIGLNIDRFSKHEKDKRRRYEFFETNEKEEYINYLFPASLVIKYSSLKDDELQQFMQQYRPTYDWLRKNKTEEDLMYYINEKLKLFFKRG